MLLLLKNFEILVLKSDSYVILFRLPSYQEVDTLLKAPISNS